MRTAAIPALVLGLTLLAGGCGGGETDGGGGSSGTALTIVFREDSERPDTEQTWSLTCDPPAGSHPDPEQACEALERAGATAFVPPPGDRACAEIYGGPQVAIVSGRVRGRRVWARLSRGDGCQMQRWDRIPSLLPAGGVR